MNKTIKLRVKKEIEEDKELKVLKLKGTLISRGYTEIIHIADENEDFHLNTFTTLQDQKKEVENYILDYISSHNVNDIITLVSTVK
ncbi:hypothetical protein [Flavobacterium sp. LHD-85]|uniref:hypothetical protein n=1 Tax=Flavobacterium sp. LHD-85 TaxID=3071410 RepID=UPI0027E0EA29|nr:hypothetical protein [Flavobacterium sp. LHD-85]MDQ6527668.1 hypothetical protein [Flavobacterium sp. LHD-85]